MFGSSAGFRGSVASAGRFVQKPVSGRRAYDGVRACYEQPNSKLRGLLFSSTPQTLPLRSRAWGIGLGTIIMVGVPIMIISAKTVQITLPLLLVAALVGAATRRRLSDLAIPLSGATLILCALILFAGMSALWAAYPLQAVSIVMMAAVIAIGSLILIALMRMERLEDAAHMGEGLWIGLLVGAAYTAAEALSDQAIKIWAYNLLQLGPEQLEPDRYFTWDNGVLISVHSDDLARNVVPIPLLLWPALMGVAALPARAWRRMVGALLYVLSAVAVFAATSETAKLALLAGTIGFALAWCSALAARYVLSVAWIVACLGVVPLVLMARYLEWQDADWLQLSAQLRILIWAEIARLSSEAPVFGVGADMTYFLPLELRETPSAHPSFLGFTFTHPHNAYLQIWYELGFVGAGLFAVFGVLVVQSTAKLGKEISPFALALFAAAAVQIGFSYNIWQIWFMCLFGFAVAMLAMTQNLLQRQPVRVA